MKKIVVRSAFAAAVLAAVGHLAYRKLPAVSAQSTLRFLGPISSQPLALSADDNLLAVVNPDNNTVSLFDVRPSANQKLAEIRVGSEPNGVAVSPDGSRIYVANTVSGTVSVVTVDQSSSVYAFVSTVIAVGTEPYGLALTPSGKKLYVTNARSNSVSVIDTTTNQVVRTITDVGIEPRGIAMTNTGTDDAQQTVFVTQFLALPAPGKQDGSDDAKVAKVTAISVNTDTVIGQTTLNPIADTGFKAAGDSLARVAAPATPTADDFKFVTGAYPNQLNNIAVHGRFAYVPNTGASPNGPTRFDVNTQSLLSVIDTTSRLDAGKTINMHQAVSRQTNSTKLFITQPWSMAFKRQADEAYVISAASNIMIKLKVDSNGQATVQNDPTDSTRVLEIPTGKNPRGIVVSSSDKTAFVMNYISRDVTVVDLTGTVEKAVNTLRSTGLPAAGTLEDRVQIGKELYNTSVGEFDPPASGQPAITGRMSMNGWGACSACHPFGLSDNVVWIFAAGPRRTVPQHADFVQGDATTLRALNWSAIFDEEEDFEGNIRNVSGGRGLLVLADGVTQDPALAAFTPPSGGRNQLKVRGVGAWDAIKAYIVNGIRAPISPVSKTDSDVAAGRTLFIQNKCQNCHGGPLWSVSKVRSAAPPDASTLTAGQLIAELKNVGTFDAKVTNEVRANAAAPLGAAGFNPPTLLSIGAFPQTFFHNGSANSLDEALQNVAHRSAGTGQDLLQGATQRAQLIKFLQSIDSSTPAIPADAPSSLRTVSATSGASTIAPDSYGIALGTGLATQTATSGTDLPTVLGGSAVQVRDTNGAIRLSQLYFSSPAQINYVMPGGTAPGNATVTIYSASGATAVGTVQVASISPGIFAANGAGTGVAAATAIRVNPDNSQTPVAVFQCGTAAGSCVGAPIDLTAGPVFLTLYGSGIRNRTSLANVRANVGGADATVLFAGPQGGFVGLDQVNIQIPASLAGRGEVQIVFTVDSQTTNPVSVNIR